jgi:adenylate cyclase
MPHRLRADKVVCLQHDRLPLSFDYASICGPMGMGHHDFRVADWLIEPDLNRISTTGKVVPIEPKVMEVLVFLADHPDQVLSKQEIMKGVWPDTFVGDEVLRYSISELRKAFGDDAQHPRIVDTIQRRGYRLIAPIALPTPSAAPHHQPSIAILSFSDMSPERDQEYFCDGLAEEIISRLACVKGLRVAARTSAFAFKGKAEDVRTIGKHLGVATVLEGSVRKAATQLRVTVQLIDVEDGCHLWSERYDRELKDVFAIQDEIARSIATALKITLGTEERSAISRPPATNVDAYDFYLRGRQLFYHFTRKKIEIALGLFSRAIEIDPRCARAYAGIAFCSAYLHMYGGSKESDREKADSASRMAVELDPESAEAHASRGVALSLKKDYEEAERAFESAIRLAPGLFEAYYFYARTAFVQGKLERAIVLYEKASEVNPADYQAPLLVAQSYDNLGRHREADAARRRGVRIAEAKFMLEPDDSRALYMGANGLVALGQVERGLKWTAQALALDPDEPMVLYNAACIQSLAGRIDDALDSLERAVHNGLTQKSWLEHDSNLDALRKSRRYKALIQQLAKNPLAT